MTSIAVTDSAGAVVVTDSVARDSSDQFLVFVSFKSSLPIGKYRVRWKTAAADGHPSSGEFSFRIFPSPMRRAPTGIGNPVAHEGSPLDSEVSISVAQRVSRLTAASPALIATRFVLVVMLVGMVGAVVFRGGVLSRTPGSDKEGRARLAAQTAALSARCAGVYLMVSLVRLYLQHMVVEGELGVGMGVREIAARTEWGHFWIMQFVAALVVLAGLAVASKRRTAGWWTALIGCVLLTVARAFAGHAGSAPSFRALAVADDALHMLGAAGWLGTLFWFTTLGMPYVRSTGDGRAQRAATMTAKFSPVALVSVGIVTVTGLISAWLRLGEFHELWTSLYGQVLMAKLAFVVIVAMFGFINWQQIQPLLGEKSGATAAQSRTAKSELAFGVFVILATSILLALPAPSGG